ncbi:PAS domain S-box-containing protein [Singulisphaera sp. GP187]|uniref:response regulator n=1 Tax=Singulisphaera sp. GP187 TaxID=1882752 RepID=UPI00092A571F|nr:response regulator [Singulisphaera sp. GP187]SIO56248.1 PAS domain S-box-containing protein [Singulisphaera sp. GP187]
MTDACRVESAPTPPAPATEQGGPHGPGASPRLRPILGTVEIGGLGLTGLLLWLFVMPGANAELGRHSLLMWVPLAATGILINLQVKRLGERWPDMAGGTPNYTFRLLRDRHPWLARYATAAAFLGWASVPALASLILADMSATNLLAAGLPAPLLALKILFIAMVFVIAFRGTRTLTVLNLFFTLSGFGMLLALMVQGLGWLAKAPVGPIPMHLTWPDISFRAWAKWYLLGTYAAYSVETAASFVADSRRPRNTLKYLAVIAAFIPLVLVGGSWVVQRMTVETLGVGDHIDLTLTAVARPLWGAATPVLVTFLITTVCLQSCTTGVCTSPRVWYQLALDGGAAPVFRVLGRGNVPGPSLALTLVVALIVLLWPDRTTVFVGSATSWFLSYIALHLGLCLERGRAGIHWTSGALGGLVVTELMIFLVGGLAWGWRPFLGGLLAPVGVLAADAAIARFPFPVFTPAWWLERSGRPFRFATDSVALHVIVLLVLVTSGTVAGWFLGAKLGAFDSAVSGKLFAILIGLMWTVSIGISCWTTLPQIARAIESREQAVATNARLQKEISERTRAENALREVNEGLESRVAERTAELRLVNEQLLTELAERARVEGELKASEKRFRSLSASSPIGIFLTDADGLGIYANERCLSLVKLSNEETLGFGWTKAIHPDDRDEVFTQWIAASQAGRDFSHEYRILTADGEITWVHARAAVLPSDDGGIAGHVGTLEDISGRKLAEKELRQSELRFQMLAHATNDAAWDRDLVTNGLWMNDCVRTLFGYPQDAVGPDGSWWSDRVHPEDRERIETSIQALLDGEGSYWSGEYRFRHEDGSYLDVFDRGYVIRDEAMRPVRMIGSMMDISERKRAEAEIRKAQQTAVAANQAKSEFLANMSHEIRTPMNGVLGMLDLTLRSRLEPRQREFLALAKSSAETLLRLLNDILDFSKIEAGLLELESVPLSLRETIGDNLKTLALQADKKGLELTHSVAPDVPDAVLGDPGRLSQIFVNLVGNAMKFTERGEVAVRVDLGARAGDAIDLHVTVRDTGIGILPEKQPQIFAAFTQADSSTTRQFGGTGLGLTICAHLVQSMGGRLWLESVVGQGSTFHFTARLSLQEVGTTDPVPPSRVNLDGLPVLVVDDNATHRLILEELVTAWGMKPTAVDSGPAALVAMRHAREADEPYSLVLLDVLMPGMDGFEVAEWIQRDAELAGTAIMMLSSVDYRGDVDRCRAVGAAAFLRKPIKESELLDAILAVLGLATPARAGSPSTDTPPLPPPSVRLRILLAEDIPVNQRLAVTLLEDRGHSVVVANDGQETLDLLERESFDLILMDVQMPRMDGFQATAAIRADEAGTGRRIPILAMTAHAMKGDRERCLATGMDGYISKPIRAEPFLTTVEGWFPTTDGAEPEPEPERNRDPRLDGAAMVFDLPGALARVRDKRPLLGKMAALFLTDCPGLLDQIRAAVATGNAPLLERAAHRMKGSAANLSAPRVVEVAGRLEEIGRESLFAEADAACSALEDEIVHLGRALETLNEEDTACES